MMIQQKAYDRQEIMNHLEHDLQKKIKNSEKIITFARRYYANCSLEDLAIRSTEELSSIVVSQWEFILQRTPGEAKIRVFNPSKEADNWQSTHTIIQVSHDDIPFLVDSIRMEVARNGFEVHYAIHFGGLKVVRDKNFRIKKILRPNEMTEDATSEAPIYFEIDRQIDPLVMENLQKNIDRVLSDVRAAVYDWQSMITRVKESLVELDQSPLSLDPAELSESKDFLNWLVNNHFTFMGSRDYRLIGQDTKRALQFVPGSGLGVLREGTPSSHWYTDLPPQVRKLAISKELLVIAKTSTLSTVHRAVYTDYVGIKRFNAAGELMGERRFIGLYTSTAYHSSPRYIPFLRHKVEKVIEAFHFPSDSHNGKEIVHVLETLPRDDLFQANVEELIQLAEGILHLQERRQIRLFVRKDAYERYFSCLVYVPSDICNTELSLAMQDILMTAFSGTQSTFTTTYTDSILARLHYVVRVTPGDVPVYNIQHIEQQLREVASSWTDELKNQLLSQFGEAEGLKLYTKYRKAFPASYTEYYLPRTAIDDIRKIESLSPENPLEMLFYKMGSTALRLKLFHSEHTIALSDVLPTLENMGFRVMGERPHQIVFRDGSLAWISDFDMVHASHREIDIENIRDHFQDAFNHIWFQQAEDDGFNQLVIIAQLTWHEIAVLRGYTRYLRQTGFTFSQSYIEQALVHNVSVTRNLIELFRVRFSPEYTDQLSRPDLQSYIDKITQALDEITSLDEDRIIRRLLEVILATLRTNYFQTTAEGNFKSYISFKLNPNAISDLPLPRPMYEIFVYSPRVEGVHLRAGKVARGGLRWSDRREDFRTEILGLMKAQQVKNSVIVPVGAKGGFYPKKLPLDGDRDAIMQEAIYCYTTFIRGLLDITDNIGDGGIIIPPVDVVRYDEDDPYLVVAADKGTATFSDIANAVAKEYGFWLDDAFASGGSEGYDHKKMGITARGAWESVKRHFRELGLNPMTTDFTVVGIGDMSGDVFGNGLLLSPHVRLVAAYNHQHIFIDPEPNAAESFEERKRLFHLSRSSWSDYNVALISSGGGVFSRSAKFIRITPEMKKVFSITQDTMIPNDLIRAILKTPVNLIWNGGIGTFVKASQETHMEVGDRTNDAIRVDGRDLTARVICEGGNLGLTQLGRVEYALAGGILYTDFIDNSAGVDCSDHEVNIKILLNRLVLSGEMKLDERNTLLEQMTEEVATLVLYNNYQQTQILSLEASVASQTMDLFQRYMNEMEKQGRLDRALEFLPNDKELQERKMSGHGLTRPELAIMISYCKMYLKQAILASDVPEDAWFVRYLVKAFPTVLREKYLPVMIEHPLKREIIATQLSKHITDHMGVNFVERLHRETGASVAFIMRAYVIAESIYGVENLWKQIEVLDYQVSVSIQHKMMLQLYYLVRRATRWILRNRKPGLDLEATIHYFSASINELIISLPKLLTTAESEMMLQEIQSYQAQGVPETLAKHIAASNTLFTSLDIVEAALKNDLSVSEMAKTYYELGSDLELNWIRDQMNAYPIANQWDELARSAFRDDLDRAQRKLCVSILLASADETKANTEDRIKTWLEQCQLLTGRWQNLLSEIRSSNTTDFVTYSVVLRELIDFAQAG